MNDESKTLGVSVRGWLAVCIVITVCSMSHLRLEVKEPLYSGFLIALGFYLGSKTQNGNGAPKP